MLQFRYSTIFATPQFSILPNFQYSRFRQGLLLKKSSLINPTGICLSILIVIVLLEFNFPDFEIITHWSIKDPFHVWNDNEEDLEPYRMDRNEIKEKIKDLLQKYEIKNL